VDVKPASGPLILSPSPFDKNDALSSFLISSATYYGLIIACNKAISSLLLLPEEAFFPETSLDYPEPLPEPLPEFSPSAFMFLKFLICSI
jgi:hypothetical protein